MRDERPMSRRAAAPGPRYHAKSGLVADLNAPDGGAVRPPHLLANDVTSAITISGAVAIAVVVIAGVVRIVAVAIGITVGRIGPGEAETQAYADQSGPPKSAVPASTPAAAAEAAADSRGTEAAATNPAAE